MVVRKTVLGTLSSSPGNYILHCTSCIKRKAGTDPSLSVDILRTLSVNTHPSSETRVPGTVQIRTSAPGKPSVITCYVQWTPGPPGKVDPIYTKQLKSCHTDTLDDRKGWLQQCLDEIDYMNISTHINAPYHMCVKSTGIPWEYTEQLLQNASAVFKLYAYVHLDGKRYINGIRTINATPDTAATTTRKKPIAEVVTQSSIDEFFIPQEKRRRITQGVCSFDVETDGLTDPVNITCAVTLYVDVNMKREVRYWHSNYKTRMTPKTCLEMCSYMYELYKRDVAFLTFNGAGFDFKHVHALLDRGEVYVRAGIKIIARNHYDLMYQFLCENGYCVSLNSILQGMKLSEKTGNGKDAIGAWVNHDSTIEDKNGVLKYCESDVTCVYDLYTKLLAEKEGHRMTKKNKRSNFKWKTMKTVTEALKGHRENPPDTSWMKDGSGIKPSRMIEWSVTK